MGLRHGLRPDCGYAAVGQRRSRAIDLAAGERLWAVLLSRSGKRLDRHGATRIVRRVARKAGVTK
ncbi:MAG: integrase, partial [Actinobacteria bacterium]|nr:integrase [Actinomycetota bacterium]